MTSEFDEGVSLQLSPLGVLSMLGEARTSKGKSQWKRLGKSEGCVGR